MAYRHLERGELDNGKLESFIRYLVICARNWSLTSYKDAQENTGLSFEAIGNYLGNIGNFCAEHDGWGPLPAMVLSADGLPSEGFILWRESTDRQDHGSLEANWANDLSECLRSFYRQDTSFFLTGLGDQVRNFNQ
jgi:hypothetical protein